MGNYKGVQYSKNASGFAQMMTAIQDLNPPKAPPATQAPSLQPKQQSAPPQETQQVY